jgi:hypothetical protein
MMTTKKTTAKTKNKPITIEQLDELRSGLLDMIDAINERHATNAKTISEQGQNMETCDKNIQWACDKIEQIELKLNQVAGRMGL